MEQLPISIELLQFYGWWQLVVCLFACLSLLAIWWHLGSKSKDFGPVWLALSVLFWSMSGAVEIYYAHLLKGSLSTGKTEEILFTQSGWRSIFSLFNSLFILNGFTMV